MCSDPIFWSLLSFADDDYGALVLLLAGFIYSMVLYYSMIIKPSNRNFITGLLILGINNIFVYLTISTLMFLPKEIVDFLKYLPLSLTGAIITLLVLNKLWASNISRQHSLVILSLIALGSLLTPILEILIYSIVPETSMKGLSFR